MAINHYDEDAIVFDTNHTINYDPVNNQLIVSDAIYEDPRDATMPLSMCEGIDDTNGGDVNDVVVIGVGNIVEVGGYEVTMIDLTFTCDEETEAAGGRAVTGGTDQGILIASIIRVFMENDYIAHAGTNIYDPRGVFNLLLVSKITVYSYLPAWRNLHQCRMRNSYAISSRSRWHLGAHRMDLSTLNKLICYDTTLSHYYGDQTVVIYGAKLYTFKPATTVFNVMVHLLKNRKGKLQKQKRFKHKMDMTLHPIGPSRHSHRGIIPHRHANVVSMFFDDYVQRRRDDYKTLLRIQDPIGLFHTRILHKHIFHIQHQFSVADIKSILVDTPHVYQKYPIYFHVF